MKSSDWMRAVRSCLLLLATLLLGVTAARAQTSSAVVGEKSKAAKAKTKPLELELRRAMRDAQREVARARRDARVAPQLAQEDWEALQEIPWPVIHESMALARDAMDVVQAELHNLDLSEIDASLAELAIVMPPGGIPPVYIPPMPALPPLPPIPALAPMALVPPHFDHCRSDWRGRDSFHSASEYQPYLSEDERLRVTALGALINQDEAVALSEIKTVIAQNQNWAMRAAAIELLACVEDQAAVVLLREALHRETDQRVRLAAVRALSHRDEPEAREALQELLKK